MPFALQTLHALEGHKHLRCTAENEKHYHQKEIDCQFFHLKITYNTFDFSSDLSIYQPESNFKVLSDYYKAYFYLFPSSKSSRAPPVFIV